MREKRKREERKNEKKKEKIDKRGRRARRGECEGGEKKPVTSLEIRPTRPNDSAGELRDIRISSFSQSARLLEKSQLRMVHL